MKKVIIIILVVVVFLTGAGIAAFYFGSGYLVDKVLEKAAETPFSKPVPSNSSSSADVADTTQNTPNLFSSEYVSTVKEKLTPNDKAEITSIIVKNISLSDVNELIKMLPDGISADEAEVAKTIIQSNLTQEQIKQLLEYYNKYK